ncbi:MAG: PEGA domain-containing protein [Patescibacteria group bacterium]
MTKKIRDFLFPLFIVIFVIMTIITSLYASGYKLNLTWPLSFNRLLLKTGMLAVATEPTKAIIYLNNKPQNDLSINPWKKDYIVTPAKIKSLLPGEYELRLETEGYWPYKQKINIYSGETTFVEDVNLFKNNSPLLILNLEETGLSMSTDSKYIYASSAKKIITLKNDNVRNLNLDINQIDNGGHWLKNNKLFESGIIFDPSKENADTNYASIIGSGATNWFFEENSGELYYQNNNSINRLDINKKTSAAIISGANYLDYEVRVNNLFTITNTDNQTKLNSYSLNNSKLNGEWTLPNSGHYKFDDQDLKYLTIYDDQNKTLYLFDENNLINGPMIIRNINNWSLFNNQALIYTNDFEIYIFNFSNSRSDLITRRSEKIKEIIWNTTGNYLIFSEEKNLNVLDFKNRNTTTLVSADKISSPVLDIKNNNLYFWAKIGDKNGIYKMLMQ